MKLQVRRINSGFTLIEVMLAGTILTIALLAILLVYMNCFELFFTSRNLTYATNAIHRKIEEIRDHPFDDITNFYTQPGNRTFDVDDIQTGSMGVIYIDPSNTDPDFREIVVSVSWRQRANRIIGEDLNLNGIRDAGEDINDNLILDSPAQLITLITNR